MNLIILYFIRSLQSDTRIVLRTDHGHFHYFGILQTDAVQDVPK